MWKWGPLESLIPWLSAWGGSPSGDILETGEGAPGCLMPVALRALGGWVRVRSPASSLAQCQKAGEKLLGDTQVWNLVVLQRERHFSMYTDCSKHAALRKSGGPFGCIGASARGHPPLQRVTPSRARLLPAAWEPAAGGPPPKAATVTLTRGFKACLVTGDNEEKPALPFRGGLS